MPQVLQRLRTQLTQLWERTEKRDRTRFLTIVGVSLAVMVVALVLLTRTQYAVLYRDMEPSQAGEVLALLSDMGVKTKAEGAGTILVPADNVDQLAMDLAREGYPKSGYTYELLGRGSGFGATDAEKRMYARLDLQERLGTTLSQGVPGIAFARVEISQQDNSRVLLTSQMAPTTASIMLTLQENTSLSDENVSAIESYVAASVEGLDPEHVFITDQYLRRLNWRGGADLSLVSTDYEREATVRNDFIQSIQAVLSPIFGAQNVLVSGKVTLDFDEHSTQSVSFAPVVDDLGIDISLREITERAHGTQGVGGDPGVDSNGAAPLYPEVTEESLSEYSKITREINREVNETRESIVHARGTIQDLSFSVAINLDGLSSENNSVDAVKNLVGGVVGLSPEEYDRISVEFRKFDGVNITNEVEERFTSERRRTELFDLIKVVGLYVLIALCFLVIVTRILRLGRADRAEAEALAGAAVAAAEESAREANEYGELVKLATAAAPPGEPITVTKSPTRERVEEFIDKNPDAVANLLRNWINEEPKGRKR
ncbi:MAG: flagellar M-ring protein FliF [Oscillospiraceae bacterium]|nr:flagellar M-ring protein FliF [Oscillospiraceae bacterium]